MKQIWQFNTLWVLVLVSVNLTAQTDTIWQQKPSLVLSGFADIYSVYDFNQPQGNFRQHFFFNHNRHQEVNLNLGFLKLGLKHNKYRVNITMQTGTYANDNYVMEIALLKTIYEANVGMALNKNNTLWVDAGVMPSHIGFESAISMDNYTLTRSILAENSPYFLAGAKLTYQPSSRWEFAILVVNGWQRIQRVEGNTLPSFGTQVVYKPTELIKLNWSTFIGTDDPDTTQRMRYFNNLYGQFQLSDKIGIITGFDIGIQQINKGSDQYNCWYSPVIIGQYSINDIWKTAVRLEYYQDTSGVIIPIESLNGFKTSGFSVNIDYTPISNIACRLEGRWLNSNDALFVTQTNPSHNDIFIGMSMAIKFSEILSK